MDLQGIKSSDLSVGDLFKDFYTVPDYQREYVWSTSEVERLFQDVFSEYSSAGKAEILPDYFIGTIVTNYLEDKLIYELIDGQQRVTTLYVLLVAIRDCLEDMGDGMRSIDTQLFDLSVDREGNEIPRHRVELQYEDSQDALELLAQSRDVVPIDALPSTTLSAANLVEAYKFARSFLLEEVGGTPETIRRFYAYVARCVKLIRIRTESLDRALWIFETINERGRGLDAMDLLKNLLFRHAKSDEYEKLKQRWKALVDALYDADERPIGFIKYYLLANHAEERIQADRVYGWLTDRKNTLRPNYWDDPIGFVNKLLGAARAFVRFADGKLEDGTNCRPLKNIWHLSHTARQHLILLLAARGLPSSSVAVLAKEVENLYCVFLLTRRTANVFEKDFVIWATKLRKMTRHEELEQFLRDVLIPARNQMTKEFEFAVENMSEDNIPKYRLKYVLSKLAQYLDEQAYGPREIDIYLDRRINIEHILALNAKEEDVELFGGIEAATEAKHHLGNLTLLELSHNAVVSNNDFSKKCEGYIQSNILLTKGLARASALGKDTAINRAIALVGPYDRWNKESFEERQKKLVKLARIVWATPSPAGP